MGRKWADAGPMLGRRWAELGQRRPSAGPLSAHLAGTGQCDKVSVCQGKGFGNLPVTPGGREGAGRPPANVRRFQFFKKIVTGAVKL